MTDKEKKYLVDVITSVDHIFSFTKDITSFSQYSANVLVKSAVERHLAIIGEAINKLQRESPENQLRNATQIISLRNRLIHSYDSVDDRIIWTIVIKHLKPLYEEVVGTLKNT
jgi:uncharacterized protein with HEPN domain